MNSECIFCRIAAGNAPASVVAESPEVLAFMDLNQPAPGHILVIPRAHVRDIYGLDADIAAEIFQVTVEVARAVKTALRPDGLNLFQANERAGQQEVFHFHIHILARFAGDRERVHFGWHNHQPPRNELDRLAAQVRAAL
jgi:histidine triad (HIT) family protein